MNRCAYCGHESADETTQCSNCGTEFSKQSPATSPKANPASPNKSLFRWKPASIILIIIGAIYLAGALVDLWLSSASSGQGDRQMARLMSWSAFWHATIGVLCISARQMMKRQSSTWLAAGAVAIVMALSIEMRQWLSGLLSGKNPFPLLEALLFWLPLIYCGIFAVKESLKLQNSSRTP